MIRKLTKFTVVIRIVTTWLLLVILTSAGYDDCDFNDSDCRWTWSDGFILLSAENSTHLNGTGTGPPSDSRNNSKSLFLYYSPTTGGQNVKLELISPLLEPTRKSKCYMELSLHMFNMDNTIFKIIIQSSASNSSWEIQDFEGNSFHRWERYQVQIGEVSHQFNILFEVIYSNTILPSHLAIDNIRIIDCYDTPLSTECAPGRFRCSNKICIFADQVCDTVRDCRDGEDEEQDCDQIPKAAYCTFEEDTCGWNSTEINNSIWVRHSGVSPNTRTGPSADHTYNNSMGTYMLARFPAGRTFGFRTELVSPVFDPPPYYHRNIHSAYYNTCSIRFFYHKYGSNVGDLILLSLELDTANPLKPKETELWRRFGNQGDYWHKGIVEVPLTISNKYYLVFSASKGVRGSDTAIDDVSMSPACFGIGVPPNETFIDPNRDHENQATLSPEREPILERFEFNTCGSKGRLGPNEYDCQSAYQDSITDITMKNESHLQGIQIWKVPADGMYTIFVNGASGGNGAFNRQKSLGAFLRAAFHWTKDDEIFIVVGQQGTSACSPDTMPMLRSTCNNLRNGSLRAKRRANHKLKEIKKLDQGRENGGGGGGGGASYVFKIDIQSNKKVPLIISGGGGGLSRIQHKENSAIPHGIALNNSMLPINGYTGNGGGGGGWDDDSDTIKAVAGQSLNKGARGGFVCNSGKLWGTHGGFGGGGGGCISGGGGGGYRGGDSMKDSNGYGGTSFYSNFAVRPLVQSGSNKGDGSVTIVPAQPGCGCEYLCLLLDLDNEEYVCICPEGRTLNIDGYSCDGGKMFALSPTAVVFIVLSIVLGLIFCAICTHFALIRYRKSQNYRDLSHEPLSNNPEVQLNTLRTAGMVSEYNPNYEFGGGTCSARDLKEIPREQLTLVKALGQGAFGEVYEGFLTNPNDNSEKSVAVKTLPELSSSQAEMDFLMEALIMSKFNHPNIVTFIGVCFEKMPRFIVLELLQGGDLKSYLREHRPKPNKQSTLTVSDLLSMALDVAMGCQYLEENHFIHRDIAARNCLLTTKNADRVVKIADFGMARDIYRADYYRKGGKAMLPVKWMPPEAFLDGIFTAKTDVWSFGVLVWEVISMGYMPYPGRGNQEVMQLVTSGGRLEPPTNCPSPVYHVMMQCWHPLPSERPNFATLIERLGYCLQDPDVINAPLPVFNRPPSMERDATVMRTTEEESGGCLQVQRPGSNSLMSPGSEDYLIPTPHSMYSLTNTATDRTDLQSGPSIGSSDQMLEMSDRGRNGGDTPNSLSLKPSPTWETNFMTPDTLPALDDSIQRPSGVLKKRAGGYTEVPSQENDQIANTSDKTLNGPISTNMRKSSIHSVDALPIAPEIIPKNENDDIVSHSQSNLALDASALAKQMNSGLPRRYMNVDVNFNTGADSNGSATRIGSDQSLTNKNEILGSLDGFAGVNPVA